MLKLQHYLIYYLYWMLLVLYLKEIKEKTIIIIIEIIKECPGIDINLGFIGYAEINEKYYDYDFTKDHIYLKNIINKIYTPGGGYPYPMNMLLFLWN